MFDRQWFKCHQKILLFLLNAPVVRIWFRYLLRINGKRSSVGKRKILRIDPNAITWLEKNEKGKPYFSTEFRTHDKFAKRLYYAFYPLWWAFHTWDMATKWKPEWNLGFDMLTVFPDADPESTSVDGTISFTQAESNPWSDAVNAVNGTSASDNTADLFLFAQNISNNDRIDRIVTLFDTSALTVEADISAATFSLHGDNSILTASGAWSWRLVSSNPASNTALVVGDYDSFGSTAYAADYGSGDYVALGYNDQVMNATGIAAISLDGITKFGVREVEHDIGNMDPGNDNRFVAQYRGAEQSGTADDPKLVVTYTLGGGATNMLLMGIG